MLASEADLGGFVSSLAASLAGSYVNSEVMPQISDKTHRPTGLGSNGSVEFEHDGSGFHAVNIDFDRREFQATIDAVKAKIFEKCLDQNVPVESAAQLAREVEGDLREIQQKVESREQEFSAIDDQMKLEIEEKIIEVSADTLVVERRRAERENLNTVSQTIRKNAQEKSRLIDAKIVEVEVKKQELVQKLDFFGEPIAYSENIPTVKEAAVAICNSAIEALKRAKSVYVEIIKNPIAAAEKAYQEVKLFVREGIQGGRIMTQHPNMIMGAVSAEAEDIFMQAGAKYERLEKFCIFNRSTLIDGTLDAAEFLPGDRSGSHGS
jgi:hypothetical protein